MVGFLRHTHVVRVCMCDWYAGARETVELVAFVAYGSGIYTFTGSAHVNPKPLDRCICVCVSVREMCSFVRRNSLFHFSSI